MSVLICSYLISDQMSSSDVLIDAYIKLFRPPHRSPWDGVHQPRSVLLCRPRRGRSMPRHGIRTPAQENFESSSTRPPSKANLLWWLLAVVCKQVLEHSCSLGIKVSLMEIVSNRRLVSASWVSRIECFQIKRFWAEELLVLNLFYGLVETDPSSPFTVLCQGGHRWQKTSAWWDSIFSHTEEPSLPFLRKVSLSALIFF